MPVAGKTTKKTTPKNNQTPQDALQQTMAATPVTQVPLSALVKSPLNMRTLPCSADGIRALADTIASAGLLHNLIVHTLPDGLYGVAAGSRRLAALQLLRDEGRSDADFPVPVKCVSDEVAAAATVIENDQRTAVHPSEQIAAFAALAAQGHTPAQTGAALGYGMRHVQRMLKLAGLAPSLLALLADDTLSVEQCQALCLEDSPARQVDIWERAKATWGNPSAHCLRQAVTDTEISLDSALFAFVGRAAYEAAGGVVREDLFSHQSGNGTADGVLVTRLAQEKLTALAQRTGEDEGWAWSAGRLMAVRTYGDDPDGFVLADAPACDYTRHEQARLDELYAQYDTFDSACEDSDALAAEIAAHEEAAEIRAWGDDVKKCAGVLVSLRHDGIQIQRGVYRQADVPETEPAQDGGPAGTVSVLSVPDAAEGISAPLLTRMSSERTLAVQGALIGQPEKAMALLVWRLCGVAFGRSGSAPHPFTTTMTVAHHSLTENAPSGRDGAAFGALMQEKARLSALLPAGWENDMTAFFALDGGVLVSLLAFCCACSVDGVQRRTDGRTSRSPLDALESALDFHLRDWWQPDHAGYFAHLKKAQNAAALDEAGLPDAARQAETMKKDEAGRSAEQYLAETRWVPGWLTAPAAPACTEDERTGATDAVPTAAAA